MAGSPLMVHSTISVQTNEGCRQIHLCFGDITSTSSLRCLGSVAEDGDTNTSFTNEPADVILISAFQGDYSPTPTCVIGAMKRNLGISVRDLARDKQEDLRKHFHCWWSKPLPKGLPYRQVLCFETPWSGNLRHPVELVGDVFRCLVAMFQNQEKTVITPLLSTGDQHFSQSRMMKAMLEAAVNWVRAGLPMKHLKIVIYQKSPSKNRSSYEAESVVRIFEDFKVKIEGVQNNNKKIEHFIQFDVYMSFNKKDENKVKEIKELITNLKPDIRIYQEQQDLCQDKAWQDDMYNMMTKCRRVVTFLSPAYLESPACVEQYNIAMCCKRSMHRELLAPFYIETVTDLPTYMTLVQYADCRKRDGSKEKMLDSIKAFVSIFKTTVRMSVLKPLSLHYDVFISYSHRNTEKVKIFLTHLKELTKSRDLSIFFDKNELRTGSSWQQQLYTALDNASTIVTFLSPDYLTSQICQEEYNLALMKHIAVAHAESDLVPVLIEPMEMIPVSYSKFKVVDATKNFQAASMKVAKAVDVKHSTNQKQTDVFGTLEIPINAAAVLQKHRKKVFAELFRIGANGIKHIESEDPPNEEEFQEPETSLQKLESELKEARKKMKIPKDKLTKWEEVKDKTMTAQQSPQIDDNEQSSGPYDVAFVCADLPYGAFFNNLLKAKQPDLSTNFGRASEREELTSLDSARIIVALLSPNFINSGKHVDEYHVALARHRKTKGKPILYSIQVEELPKWPTYFHIVPCRISLTDVLWKEILATHNTSTTALFPKPMRQAAARLLKEYNERLSSEAMLALSAAAEDVIFILQQPDSGDGAERGPTLANIVDLDVDTQKEDDEKLIPTEQAIREINIPGLVSIDAENQPVVPTRVENGTPRTGPRPSIASQRNAVITPRAERETAAATANTDNTQSRSSNQNQNTEKGQAQGSMSCEIL